VGYHNNNNNDNNDNNNDNNDNNSDSIPTRAICMHQLSSTWLPMFGRSLRMNSRRQPNGISCVMIIMRSVIQMARMWTQFLWLTDAIILASSSSSLFCEGRMSPFNTLIATGILTPSVSGTHQPCKRRQILLQQQLPLPLLPQPIGKGAVGTPLGLNRVLISQTLAV